VLGVKDAILDGEVIVMTDAGPDFNAETVVSLPPSPYGETPSAGGTPPGQPTWTSALPGADQPPRENRSHISKHSIAFALRATHPIRENRGHPWERRRHVSWSGGVPPADGVSP